MNPHCRPWARTGLKKRIEIVLVVADWHGKSAAQDFRPAQDAIQRIYKMRCIGPK